MSEQNRTATITQDDRWHAACGPSVFALDVTRDPAGVMTEPRARSATTCPDLVPFRFEIPEEHLATASPGAIQRLMAFVNVRWTDGCVLEQVRDWSRLVSVTKGLLPQPSVTVIQALAMGHDVDVVIDLLEGHENGRRDT